MRNHARAGALALAALLLGAAAAQGEVQLSEVISENCVLQRDTMAPVWGWAAPGEKVTVAFAGQSKSATADRFGRWRVQLDPMPASAEGRALTASGPGNAVTVKTVYVGDVWLYLSQSWHLDTRRREKDGHAVRATGLPPISANAAAGVWEHRNHSRRPQAGPGTHSRWTVYRPPGKYYRNDAFYLGVGLARATKAPVGMMGLGASTLESMTPPEGFQAVEAELGQLASDVASWVPHTRRGKAAYLKTLGEIEQWVRRTRATCQRPGVTHEDFTQPPPLPGPPALGRGPTTTYNFVAHRFTPAAMRGIILQPKTFSVGDPHYLAKAKALILGLRQACGRRDLPVCFVQMHSPGRYERQEAKDPNDWVRMRDAQNQLATLPHTTVLATYDLKRTGRSDPDPGLRVAQWAAAVVKGSPVRTGPTYKSHRVVGKTIVVDFTHVGRGLTASAPLGGFQIAGPDKAWHDAKAAIEGDAVVVTCDQVAKPVAARYAWTPEPTKANLYNRDGFPALPFQSP